MPLRACGSTVIPADWPVLAAAADDLDALGGGDAQAATW
jgi:hypothetical protein